MVQISFMTQDQTWRQAQSGIRAKIYSWSTIDSVEKKKNLRIRFIYVKNPQTARFLSLRSNPSIRKPIHPLFPSTKRPTIRKVMGAVGR